MVASFLPISKFDLIVPLKSEAFWLTKEISFLRFVILYWLISFPLYNMNPLVLVKNLSINLINVVFPLPVPPIIPTFSPFLISKFIFFITSLSFSSYLKDTFLKSKIF